jgi:hypothetical protein
MTVTYMQAKVTVTRNLQGLKTSLSQARSKRRYSRRCSQLLARRSETSARKALNTAHKHFCDDVLTLSEA